METTIQPKVELYNEFIPILPMRHGNPTDAPTVVVAKSNSDPTYEAWKLSHTSPLSNLTSNSDPTYEAWKHFSQNVHL